MFSFPSLLSLTTLSRQVSDYTASRCPVICVQMSAWILHSGEAVPSGKPTSEGPYRWRDTTSLADYGSNVKLFLHGVLHLLYYCCTSRLRHGSSLGMSRTADSRRPGCARPHVEKSADVDSWPLHSKLSRMEAHIQWHLIGTSHIVADHSRWKVFVVPFYAYPQQ